MKLTFIHLIPLLSLCTASFINSTEILQPKNSSDIGYKFPDPSHRDNNDDDNDRKPSNDTSPVPKQCHDIHLLVNHTEQCLFALDHCQDYEIGFINYVSFYYCHKGRTFTLLGFISFLSTLFTTLGLTASEFLCPNLDTLSKFFKMSESLAGVTLLALGNGSPDVFSTLEAMKIDSASLAIGELIGAALFITCVVVGSMAIIKPFKVVKRPFIRDILFLLVSLTLSIIFLRDGELTILESVSMILLYITYVILVVSWDWIVVKKRRNELLDQRIRNNFLDEASSQNLARFEIETNNEINDSDILDFGDNNGIEVLDRQLKEESLKSFDEWTNTSTSIRPSILGALEFNNKMEEHLSRNGISNNSTNSHQISLDTLQPSSNINGKVSNEHNIRMSTAPEFKDDGQYDRQSFSDYEARTHSAPSALERFRDEPTMESIEYHSDHLAQYDEVQQVIKRQIQSFISNNNILNNSSGVFFTIFPTLKSFKQKPLYDKIFSIICLPLITILKLTIPVIETGNKDSIFKKGFFLLVLQCVISPFVFIFLIASSHSIKTFILSIVLSGLLLATSFQMRRSYKAERESRTKYFTIALAICGFIISITWISTIATELISIIKFFSLLFNLSDAILGVTVFAIGNSLGDFISDITIAKMGFPMMALSACFGGPLLNILLGIGGSGLYVIPSTGANIQIHVSKTLIVSGVTLFINLVFLLFVVPLNNWQMNRQIGLFMIGLWSLATFICVLFELV